MGKQKANDDPIRQAGVIPFRLRERNHEFCLITSARKQKWIFPKGFIDPGETREEAALKEAREEAGLHGMIIGDPLGTYVYSKGSQKFEVVMLMMNVSKCEKEWEEAEWRSRQWADGSQAMEMLESRKLQTFLEEAMKRCQDG